MHNTETDEGELVKGSRKIYRKLMWDRANVALMNLLIKLSD